MFEAYADPQARRIEGLGSNEQVTRFGPGAIHEVGAQARRHGIRRALLVTDRTFFQGEAANVIEKSLDAEGVTMTAVASATPTPIESDTGRAAGKLRDAGCDGVISLGGGSVQDVGKCVALLGGSSGTLHGFGHGQDEVSDVLPHIAVPTTAGTGAERSAYAFITEEHGHEHLVIHHPLLVPRAAIIDPVLHTTMPPRLTAATGLNALSAAIEAHLSPQATEDSDEDALAAIRLIAEHLPRAYRDGDDLEARTGMARAAYVAGSAFEHAGLGLVDSISLVLSSIFNVGHSAANAIVLPHVMAYDSFAAPRRLDAIAQAMGQEPEQGTKRASAAMVPATHPAVAAVQALKAELGMTETLRDRGIGWDDLYLIAGSILRHPFSRRNPRDLDEAGVVEILTDAMTKQDLPVPTGAHPVAAR